MKLIKLCAMMGFVVVFSVPKETSADIVVTVFYTLIGFGLWWIAGRNNDDLS